jgi:hypothetical protein
MSDSLRPRVKYVIGPDGSPLTIADLPPSTTRRWVIRRKAEVVAAVRGGLLSLEDACRDCARRAFNNIGSNREQAFFRAPRASGHQLAAVDLNNLSDDIGA